MATLEVPELWVTAELPELWVAVELLLSLLLLALPSSVVEDEMSELDVVEFLVEVAPHRINDATPVIPMLRMLTVAVRFVASFLPCVLMSTILMTTMWSQPFAWIRLVRHYVPARFFEAA